MDVLVAGAHGQVGQHITELLSQSDHSVRGMVRDDGQVADIEALGAEAVVADLTQDVGHAVQGCDAIIFAAGSGGEDVWGVDRDGAINLIEAAEDQGLQRFVMLSSMNADSPEDSPEALREYLTAKAEADERLRESDVTYTIVRPGPLTNGSGTGRIEAGDELGRDGEIPRADVAQTLVTALPVERTHGRTFEILAGDTPIQVALEEL
ncbi:SDR family oxidoreductase [Halomicrococcus sp. SG-WS-1]|uniref:SDR family oxidoreductase n=1 Tax=Halomicrococcus sp. SG-WS-1 TaxID=3439057 RepID=UPI003F78B657